MLKRLGQYEHFTITVPTITGDVWKSCGVTPRPVQFRAIRTFNGSRQQCFTRFSTVTLLLQSSVDMCTFALFLRSSRLHCNYKLALWTRGSRGCAQFTRLLHAGDKYISSNPLFCIPSGCQPQGICIVKDCPVAVGCNCRYSMRRWSMHFELS